MIPTITSCTARFNTVVHPRFLRLIYFFLLLLSFSFVSPVSAQIAFVKTIGTAATKTAGSSTTITVPAPGVAAGNSIIVSLAMDPAAGIVSCTDTRGNSYAVDKDISNGSRTGGVRAVILSAHNIAALTSGNTITCTHPSVAARAMSANEFSGLASSGAKDKTMSGTGNNTSASSGSTATTTQGVELLVGTIGVEGKSTETFTAGSGYTVAGPVGTSQGNATTNITVNPEYRLVTATGSYSATGTLGTSTKWAAAIVTYKALATATKLAASVSINPATTTPGFYVNVQTQNASGSPANVVNDTGISISLKTGTGILGGTLAGTIHAGSSGTSVGLVTYTKAESGVVITASRTSGDVLSPGDSDPFTVVPGNPAALTFTTQPGTATAGSPIPGPPTVTVLDSFGNSGVTSPVPVTVTIGANIGGGILTGTTT